MSRRPTGREARCPDSRGRAVRRRDGPAQAPLQPRVAGASGETEPSASGVGTNASTAACFPSLRCTRPAGSWTQRSKATPGTAPSRSTHCACQRVIGLSVQLRTEASRRSSRVRPPRASQVPRHCRTTAAPRQHPLDPRLGGPSDRARPGPARCDRPHPGDSAGAASPTVATRSASSFRSTNAAIRPIVSRLSGVVSRSSTEMPNSRLEEQDDVEHAGRVDDAAVDQTRCGPSAPPDRSRRSSRG